MTCQTYYQENLTSLKLLLNYCPFPKHNQNMYKFTKCFLRKEDNSKRESENLGSKYLLLSSKAIYL